MNPVRVLGPETEILFWFKQKQNRPLEADMSPQRCDAELIQISSGWKGIWKGMSGGGMRSTRIHSDHCAMKRLMRGFSEITQNILRLAPTQTDREPDSCLSSLRFLFRVGVICSWHVEFDPVKQIDQVCSDVRKGPD